MLKQINIISALRKLHLGSLARKTNSVEVPINRLYSCVLSLGAFKEPAQNCKYQQFYKRLLWNRLPLKKSLR